MPAFVQKLRRGHYELGLDIDRRHRLPVAFTELAAPSDPGNTAYNFTASRLHTEPLETTVLWAPVRPRCLPHRVLEKNVKSICISVNLARLILGVRTPVSLTMRD